MEVSPNPSPPKAPASDLWWYLWSLTFHHLTFTWVNLVLLLHLQPFLCWCNTKPARDLQWQSRAGLHMSISWGLIHPKLSLRNIYSRKNDHLKWSQRNLKSLMFLFASQRHPLLVKMRHYTIKVLYFAVKIKFWRLFSVFLWFGSKKGEILPYILSRGCFLYSRTGSEADASSPSEQRGKIKS